MNNARRLLVLGNCLRLVFDGKVPDARKVPLSIRDDEVVMMIAVAIRRRVVAAHAGSSRILMSGIMASFESRESCDTYSSAIRDHRAIDELRIASEGKEHDGWALQ
jgi:hypothetical protein